MNATFSKYNNAPKGTIIFGLIVTMALFSTIGAAMLSLTSTSTFSQVSQNSSANALYLAESGFRYLYSQYLDETGETARDNLLEDMHDTTYNLSGNDGSFHIDVYPFYFKTTSDSAGPNDLVTKVPGGFSPDITFPSSGIRRLKVGSDFFDYTSAAVAGQNVTFTMAATMPFFSTDTDVLPVAESINVSQTVNNNGDFSLKAGTGNLFPALNGTVEIDNKVYTYKKREGNQLTGVKDPLNPDMGSFTVNANTNIILTKFIKLHSTGIYGTGNFEAKKTIKYNLPLPYTPQGEKKEFHDTFENKDHWEESATGLHAIVDEVLKVTATDQIGVDDVGSSVSFKWSSTDIDLDSSHKFAGNYLSYDAQVKTGFDPLIPENYMAGLSFRLVSNTADADRYGVSFLKGGEDDEIPDDLVPKNGIPLILLWQQTGAGKEWLAYKKINSLLSEDVESGENGWITSDGLCWHISSNQNHSPEHSWYCTGDAITEQQLVSPEIPLVDSASSVTLSFWSWYETEGNSTKRLEILSDSGTLLHTVTSLNMGIWEHKTVDLPSSYIGQTIRIRFVFNTVTINENNSEGWYIDDINITFDSDTTVNGSTLMVRLNEAATVPFTNGNLNGAPPIKNGDFITGQGSGATGRVTGNPIIKSVSWSGAEGIITINNITGAFTDGENVFVAGSSATATVSGAFRERDNYIKVYYGDQTNSGTPDGNLLDDLRDGIPFGETPWPPDNVDEWNADNDFFTLVQWDEINTEVTSISIVDSIYEPDAIIRSSESDLLTPEFGVFDHTELGLHTFGSGSTNIYFDDFALQAITGSDTVYFSPIQE